MKKKSTLFHSVPIKGTALGEGFAPLRSLEAPEGERSAVLGDTSDSLRG